MDKNLKELLGRRIKELRLSKNITQQQLAEMIDIDQRSLSAIECGTNFPTRSLVKIAQALNVDMKELFDYEHHELSDLEKIQQISSSLQKLNSNDLNVVYRLVKILS